MLLFSDIQAAAQRIACHVHRTPVLHASSLDAEVGATLWFKAENLQKIGAFKARGAANAILSLRAEALRGGVVTHSSGNHGAAVAWAAQLRGVPARVVMPTTVPAIKRNGVLARGAEVVYCEPTVAARQAGAQRLIEQYGAVLVHPYNDFAVMAGQGTAALELLQEYPSLDAILVPVGGGGLLAGTAVAAKAHGSPVQVIGVEPAGAADAAQSFRTGQLAPPPRAETIADGLRGALGDRSFAVIQRHVDQIVTVSEDAIIRAMRLIWERLKIVVEPSAAVPLAGLIEGALPTLRGRQIGIILSGGNADLDTLPWQKPTT